MPNLSIIDYLKSETPKLELYQIRLSKTEIQFTNTENPKLLEKLEQYKILQEFIPSLSEEDTEVLDDDSEENASPFCLALPKKGHLSAREAKDLTNPKDEVDKTINILQNLCAMRSKNLNPQHLSYLLQEITGQEITTEDEGDLTTEQKTEMVLIKKEYEKYKQIPEEQRLEIAEKLSKPDSKDTLKALLNLNAEDKIEKLIATVTRFFELRFPNINLTNNDVACFHVDVLNKINLFISYENSQWDKRVVPKQLKRYIRSTGD